MGDIRVNENVLFVLDRVTGMEENSEEYHAEPAKNEVEAIEVMRHYRENVTLQYCPIKLQLIAPSSSYLLIYIAHKSGLKYRYKLCNIKRSLHFE